MSTEEETKTKIRGMLNRDTQAGYEIYAAIAKELGVSESMVMRVALRHQGYLRKSLLPAVVAHKKTTTVEAMKTHYDEVDERTDINKKEFLKYMDDSWQNEQILEDTYDIEAMHACWTAARVGYINQMVARGWVKVDSIIQLIEEQTVVGVRDHILQSVLVEKLKNINNGD